MIKDIFFVIRMFVITLVVVMIMQVKIGEKTLDDGFQSWLKSSVFVDYIEEAVDGGIAITKNGYLKAHNGIHTFLAKISHRQGKKDRGIHFPFKRYNEKDDDDDSDDGQIASTNKAGSKIRSENPVAKHEAPRPRRSLFGL